MKKIPQLDDSKSEASSSEASAEATFAGATGSTARPVARPVDTDDSTGHPAAAGGDGRKRSQRRGKSASRSQARRFARERTLQALYQWDMTSAESSDVRREFVERQDMSRVDVGYFERLFRGISQDVEPVDAALADALDRPLEEVDPIERAVLRIATFELAQVMETPARVIINEGVEITKRFGADNGHRYVNGVLDRLAAILRPLEMSKR